MELPMYRFAWSTKFVDELVIFRAYNLDIECDQLRTILVESYRLIDSTSQGVHR